MLTFSSICPHPPIIIPKIGRLETKKVAKTIKALDYLAKNVEKADLETIIVISPHLPMDWQKMTVFQNDNFYGDFSAFGVSEVKFEFKGDKELVGDIIKKSEDMAVLEHLDFLDHGTMVPLYFLAKEISKKPAIIPIAFSGLRLDEHFLFGKKIGRVILNSKKKIGVIASGDLSHRLIPGAPAGYSLRGKEFDEKLINLLKRKDIDGIINMDRELINEAGECGLRSFVILLGILEKCAPNYKVNILSYEGPFGVGYLVAEVIMI